MTIDTHSKGQEHELALQAAAAVGLPHRFVQALEDVLVQAFATVQPGQADVASFTLAVDPDEGGGAWLDTHQGRAPLHTQLEQRAMHRVQGAAPSGQYDSPARLGTARALLQQKLQRNAEQMWRGILDTSLHYKTRTYTLLGETLFITDSSVSVMSNLAASELGSGGYMLEQLRSAGFFSAFQGRADGNATSLTAGAASGDSGDACVLLDLGANIGITAILLAKLFPQCHVLAVEAVPYNFALGLANVAANGVGDQVTFLCAALAASSEAPLTIRYGLQNPGASTSSGELFDRTHQDFLGHRDFVVETVTLPELLSFYGLLPPPGGSRPAARVPFIKLDAEGAEYAVLPALPPDALRLVEEALLVGETHSNSMTVAPELQQLVHDLFDAFVQPGGRFQQEEKLWRTGVRGLRELAERQRAAWGMGE